MPPTIVPAAAGARTTLGWATDQMPSTVREGLLRLCPNSSMPLTAWLSKMKRSKPKSYMYEHFTKALPSQKTAILGVFTDNLMAVPYVAGVNPVGTVLYLQVSIAGAGEFRRGHTVRLFSASVYAPTVRGRVLSVFNNGVVGCIAVQLIQATAVATCDPSLCGFVAVYGNANRERGIRPPSVNYNPVKMWNYVQIFRTPYGVSGTQLAIDPITGNAYKEEKREKAEMHGIEMEKTFLYGHRYAEMDGDTEIRYTMGIIPMIQEYASTNIFDYRLDAEFAGQPWEVGGKPWMDKCFKAVQLWGPSRRNAFCGGGARLGMNTLVEAYGAYTFTPQTNEFGFEIERFRASAMQVDLYTHALMSMDDFDDYSMVIFPLDNLSECPLRDTHSITCDINKSNGPEHVDGQDEEWLTETGLDFKNPYSFAYLCGVGCDNTMP